MFDRLLSVGKRFMLSGLIAGIFISCRSDQKNLDCGVYRKGRFSTHMRSEGGDHFYNLVRDDSFQLERDERSGDKATFKIVWTSPCNYELTLVSTTRDIPDSILRYAKLHPLKTTILSGTNSYYLFESVTEGYTHVMRDTIWLTNSLPEKMPVKRAVR